MLLILLACSGPSEGEPDEVDTVADTSPEVDTGDSGGPPLPGSWEDPILTGASLELDVAKPELTDAMMAGDQLVLVGQEQGTDGGMWSFSLSDADAPQLLGHTTDRKHIQRACWDGAQAWGMTREGDLITLALEADGPSVLREQKVAELGAGIACDESRVVWGEGTSGGQWAAKQDAWIGPSQRIGMEVQDALLEGERLWVLAHGRLTAMDFVADALVERGHVDLPGTCIDLAPGTDWLAVACGSGGVAIVDRGEGEPVLLGAWSASSSARSVSVQGHHVWVAGWTDLILLDAQDPAAPFLAGTEPASSSVMAVAAGAEDRAYVADWNRPFVATRTGASAPEVRVSTQWVEAGGVAKVYNDGPEALWIEGSFIAAGGEWVWEIPEDATGVLSLATDDPDEPTIEVEVGGPGGLVVGAAAPTFSEPDLRRELWDLSKLHGEVVFLGLFTDG